jgi:DNA-binding Lrp family transcriptional regulator
MLNESLIQTNQDQALHLRNAVESLCEKADRLAEPDRTLVRMYLENQNSFRQMAKLLGVSEVTVARRVKKIIARLNEPKADLAFSANIKLSDGHRKIAKDYFINGVAVKTIAKKYKLSFYKTRKVINELRKIKPDAKHKTVIRNY